MVQTKNKEKTGFYIEVTCPGCGGDLELADNFFAVSCKHCGIAHRLVMPDSPPAYLVEEKIDKRAARFSIDRYLKEKSLPLSSSHFQLKTVYYPYWKVDAVLFRFRKKVEKKVVMNDYETDSEISYDTEKTEISLSPYSTSISAGAPFDGIPNTLGLRSSYIKMVTFSEDTINDKYDVLPVMKPWESVRDSLNSHISSIASFDNNLFGNNKTELFCPKAALLYFPFFVFDYYEDDGFNRYVVDGVTGRLVDHVTTLDMDAVVYEETPEVSFGAVRVEPHLCKNCGGDLPVTESLIYICPNCQILTDLDPGIEISTVQTIATDVNDKDIMVPFWSLQMSSEDAVRLQPMFGGIFRSDRMVIPAFRVQNIDAMFRLTKRISAALPKMNLEELLEMNDRFSPVTLSLTEAVMMADIFIHKDRYVRGIQANRTEQTLRPTQCELFYAPFHLENYFYVDSALNAITFEKNLI